MSAKKKKIESRVDVKIEVPIQSFGVFTFRELGLGKKEAAKTKKSPIYVFPKSTAAIALD